MTAVAADYPRLDHCMATHRIHTGRKDARIALSFVLSYEEAGEGVTMLHGDGSKTFLSEGWSLRSHCRRAI
jgi:hypothetical protein